MNRTARLTPPKHRSEACYAKDHGACSCHGSYTVRAANKAERQATRAMLRNIRQES
jgi:hypothetical protein